MISFPAFNNLKCFVMCETTNAQIGKRPGCGGTVSKKKCRCAATSGRNTHEYTKQVFSSAIVATHMWWWWRGVLVEYLHDEKDVMPYDDNKLTSRSALHGMSASAEVDFPFTACRFDGGTSSSPDRFLSSILTRETWAVRTEAGMCNQVVQDAVLKGLGDCCTTMPKTPLLLYDRQKKEVCRLS